MSKKYGAPNVEKTVEIHAFPAWQEKIWTQKSYGYWETLKTGKYWRKPGYIGFRSANTFHRVDLKPGTKPLTIFISGPYGLRKGKRSEYGIDFNNKK